MPAQEGVRGDDRHDLGHRFATEGHGLGGEVAAVGVGQAQALAAEFAAEQAVLGLEVVDLDQRAAGAQRREPRQQEVQRGVSLHSGKSRGFCEGRPHGLPAT